MRRCGVLVAVWLLGVALVYGQTGNTPKDDDSRAEEALLLSYFSLEDFDSDTWQGVYESLVNLYRHPMNINEASVEDLQVLPFLSEQQIEDILYYIHRYGGMKSTAELMMIPSLGYEDRVSLLNFVFVGDEGKRCVPPLKDVLRYGGHEVVATMGVPMYERQGVANGNYLGDGLKHSLRYAFRYGEDVTAGITASKDAGEPFFHENKWGYDHYNYYLLLRNVGVLKTLAVGCYKVGFGMGLVVNNGMSFGKLSVLSSLGRGSGGNNIRAHSSLSESGYFNGVAATVALHRNVRVSVFLSNRDMDATLKKGDSTCVQTIVTNGYHRTRTEFDKKGNLNEKTVGGNVAFAYKGLSLGVSAIYSHLDKALRPDSATEYGYKRWYPQGQDFRNVGVNYGMTLKGFAFGGETAMNGDGALATINRLTYSSSYRLKLMVLQRFYSYKYNSLYASAFSDCGRVQNESGVFVGAEWEPSAAWHVTVYSDWFYSPWKKYGVSNSSYGTDNMVQVMYEKGSQKMSARYRLKVKDKDDVSGDGLAKDVQHRMRLTWAYGLSSPLSWKTEVDGCMTHFDGNEWGYMLSQSADYALRRVLKVSAMVGYFRTTGYDSRIYVYEKNLMYNFYYPSFSGEGMRMNVIGKWDICKTVSLSAKMGLTKYFDRSVIGSGNQKIDGSCQSDLDIQVVVRI